MIVRVHGLFLLAIFLAKYPNGTPIRIESNGGKIYMSFETRESMAITVLLFCFSIEINFYAAAHSIRCIPIHGIVTNAKRV